MSNKIQLLIDTILSNGMDIKKSINISLGYFENQANRDEVSGNRTLYSAAELCALLEAFLAGEKKSTNT